MTRVILLSGLEAVKKHGSHISTGLLRTVRCGDATTAFLFKRGEPSPLTLRDTLSIDMLNAARSRAMTWSTEPHSQSRRSTGGFP